MQALVPFAGYSFGDLIRRKEKLAASDVLAVAHEILNQPDPLRCAPDRARIDVRGALVFAPGEPIPEADFCLGLGYFLHALQTGQPFHLSYLLDGLPRQDQMSFGVLHLLTRLTHPSRRERIGNLAEARALIERLTQVAPRRAAPCFRGGAARLGETADVLSSATSLKVRWFRELPEVLATPTEIEGRFLVVPSAGDPRIRIVDADSGLPAAEIVIGAPTESTAAYHEGCIYVGADDGVLYAVDLRSAAVVWKRKLGSMIRSSPVIIDGIVYVGTIDPRAKGALVAVDLNTRKPTWVYRCGEVFSSPALLGDLIVAGCDDGSVFAVRKSDGREAWSIKTGAKVRAVPASPDDVYVGSFDGSFYCVSPAGAVKWKQSPGKPFFSSPAVAGGSVICGSHDGNVYCLDRGSGQIGWTWAADSSIAASTIVSGSFVIGASTAGTLFVLNRESGSPAATLSINRRIQATPSLIGSTIYVGHDGGLTAVDAQGRGH